MIQSGSSAGLQNKHQPVKQYVTRKNYVAYRGKSVKMWCVFGGTPLPEIRYGSYCGWMGVCPLCVLSAMANSL